MYSYKNLPEKSIRIAKLLPGRFGDELAIILRVEHFDPTAKSPILPSYEALSYAWGSADDQALVAVRRKTSKHFLVFKSRRTHSLLGEFKITRNLDVALRHLRHADQSRLLWIDALCIDQSNDIEKGRQVAIMGDIFRFAIRVVVWLGPVENNSDRAMRLMEELGDQVEVDFVLQEMQPADTARDQTLGDGEVVLPFGPTDLEALYHLLCRPWFERLWVRQEIYLANESAIVACGRSVTPWQVFRRAWACLHWKPFAGFKYIDQFSKRKELLKGALFQQRNALFPYLHAQLGAIARCADPRDRIFALLSLDTDSEVLGILPDYTRGTAEVYEDVTKRCMAHYLNLNILTECEMPLASVGIKVPSWVPDWSVTIPYLAQIVSGYPYASGPFVCLPEFMEETSLRVLAIRIDVVQSLQTPNIERATLSADTEQTLLNIKRMLLDQDLCEDCIGGGSLVEAYVRVLVLETFADFFIPASQYLPQFQDSVEGLKILMDQDEKDHSPALHAIRLFLWARGTLVGRLVLQTVKKYIGLAPSSTLPGDELHVVLGCQSPLVLRPVDGGRYKIVGACHVAGLREGEAVLGAMPEGWRRVQLLGEDTNDYVPRFTHETTGEISIEDPRLHEWPIADGKRVFSERPGVADEFYVNDIDLRKRGIDARYIDII